MTPLLIALGIVSNTGLAVCFNYIFLLGVTDKRPAWAGGFLFGASYFWASVVMQ